LLSADISLAVEIAINAYFGYGYCRAGRIVEIVRIVADHGVTESEATGGLERFTWTATVAAVMFVGWNASLDAESNGISFVSGLTNFGLKSGYRSIIRFSVKTSALQPTMGLYAYCNSQTSKSTPNVPKHAVFLSSAAFHAQRWRRPTDASLRARVREVRVKIVANGMRLADNRSTSRASVPLRANGPSFVTVNNRCGSPLDS
jgi:hypothetical protein